MRDSSTSFSSTLSSEDLAETSTAGVETVGAAVAVVGTVGIASAVGEATGVAGAAVGAAGAGVGAAVGVATGVTTGVASTGGAAA